jgi:hypothetical protein
LSKHFSLVTINTKTKAGLNGECGLRGLKACHRKGWLKEVLSIRPVKTLKSCFIYIKRFNLTGIGKNKAGLNKNGPSLLTAHFIGKKLNY